MKFRYVINERTFAWQKAENVSIGKMQYVANSLTEQFGNNWFIEFSN